MELANHLPATTSLADYTQIELIQPVLREHDTAGVIGELSQILQRHGCVHDVLPFYHAALNQELLNNSAMACGLAIPHGRLNAIKELRYALGRAEAPIAWGAKGAWPVQMVFLIAVPATDAAGYLHLLASLSKLGQATGLLNELRSAPSAAAMLTVLEKVSLRNG
jgi:mannitol/fructose-specific phosphotransferase system IIA component (Ntr-type)